MNYDQAEFLNKRDKRDSADWSGWDGWDRWAGDNVPNAMSHNRAANGWY